MNWEDNRCGQMIEEMKEAIKHVEHRKQELSIVCVCVCVWYQVKPIPQMSSGVLDAAWWNHCELATTPADKEQTAALCFLPWFA